MVSVSALVEQLLDDRTVPVADAGALLLQALSENGIDGKAFLEDPRILTAPPYSVSRYLAQVTLRALQNEYETVDEIVVGLMALLERNPPTLEPARPASADRVVVPEARVVDLRHPLKNDAGNWESELIALVTSGPLRGREITIRLRSNESRHACLLVPHIWIHSTIAAYNLVPSGASMFIGCAETFLVIEPMRQVNATSVARSLHCSQPQLDQIRKGKGDTTIHTLKGILVHAIFDRLLEGETNLSKAYAETLPRHLIALASVTDENFDEEEFRVDVFRHLEALRRFIEANPRLREDTQVELKRYSATIGIQGRIDAVFRQDRRLDILELKTGKRLRAEDHAQLFIYRLLLSDLVRREQRSSGVGIDISARLLSSVDGMVAPLQVDTDFQQVLDTRNKLISIQYALGQKTSHLQVRHEGFSDEICGSCVSWTRKRCREMSTVFGDRPDFPDTRELEYFRRFTRLVERERWHVDQELADLLDDSRTEIRKKNFRTIVNARLVPGADPFTFEFEENTSDLESGDAVLIHSGNISSTATFHGYVREVESASVRISIPLKNLESGAFGEQFWTIDRFPSDVTAEASHTALYDFLVSPADKKKSAILAEKKGPGANSGMLGTSGIPEFAPGTFFNESQQRAIDRAAHCGVFHLIWGPPGTGKTKVIPEIIRRIDGSVLLGAFTNTAVDKMLLALLAEDNSIPFLRIGRAADSPELAAHVPDPSDYFSEDLALKLGNVRAVRRAMDSVRVVAATAHRACTLPYLRQRSFEMVVVDEAGQLTEPLTLGLVGRGRRFVLVGDDRQLQPVVRLRSLAQSMFERLKLQAQDSFPESMTLLDTQYRMNPEIMSVSNALFYEGRLRAGIAAADRLPPAGNPVMLIPVDGQSDGRKNEAEALAVEELVRRYRSVYGMPASAIGVVSPFRAQVALLRKLLKDTGVTIDTVERFQGGEREVMILSFVRTQGSAFVFDERRFNVAITRARRQLVLVAHQNLFRNSRYESILGGNWGRGELLRETHP